MRPEPIISAKAPAAIGTYSQAVRCGDWVFVSGQIPLLPDTMVLISREVDEQINQVFQNLQEVCRSAGGALADVCKLTIYLTDLQHFPLVNQSMETWFAAPYPARAVIEVNRLPKGAAIEVAATLYLPK